MVFKEIITEIEKQYMFGLPKGKKKEEKDNK